MPRYAKVVVNLTVRPSDERAADQPPSEQSTFHYEITSRLQDQIAPGQLVWVPFGRLWVQALVLELCEASPVAETRPIEGIVDPEPALSKAQIDLARWISDHYVCPLISAVRMMIPEGLDQRVGARVSLKVKPPWPEDIAPKQRAVLDYLHVHGPTWLRALRVRLKDPRARARVLYLEERGLVERGGELTPPRVRPKMVRFAALAATREEVERAMPNLGRASTQTDVLEFLAAQDEAIWSQDTLCERTRCTREALRVLASKGWLTLDKPRFLAFIAATPGQISDALSGPLKRAPSQQRALEYLSSRPQPVAVNEWRDASGASQATINALKARGLVRLVPEDPKVHLAISRSEARRVAREKRHPEVFEAILALLQEAGKLVWVSWIYAETGCNLDDLRRLARVGLVKLLEQEVERDPLAGRTFTEPPAPRLTTGQAQVWAPIEQALNRTESQVFLIHGVTGSGKTEIYLRALSRTLLAGKQAIVLVPEIALTPQTVQRFAARFPGLVTVLHSRLSAGERFDQWRAARAGRTPVVIGPRSAVFAPLHRLGLIIVDEEHEPSYKQEEAAPRYHARDVAVRLGALTGATVILGSATPDVVSYRRAERGMYHLLKLPQRILWDQARLSAQIGAKGVAGQVPLRTLPAMRTEDGIACSGLPEVQVVDLRQELKQGNRGILSRALHSALAETLGLGQQAILFLNRRGTASIVLCRACGHVVHCPKCSVPLAYHTDSSALVCHHCGRMSRYPTTCPACGSEHIRHLGLGTERVEQTVKELFPGARVLRWDRDVTGAKGAHDVLLGRLSRHEADVLVGTQMIAKGLDLPLVTLVGVVSADTALYYPDYRSGERAFQLLTQVAGRAGRSVLGGRAIIQTYSPEHPSIVAASRHDYAALYRAELAFRRQLGYPPFGRLARLVYSDASMRRCREETAAMLRYLRDRAEARGIGGVHLIGPSPCFLGRLRGQFRWQIIIRAPDPVPLLTELVHDPSWAVDVDPASLL